MNHPKANNPWISQYWLLIIIVLTAPLALYMVVQIMPVGDDFIYFTAPYPKNLHDRLFPFDSWWRPFDALYGHYIEAHQQLFPLLNHIIIYSFHLANTFIVYFLLRQLKNSLTALNTTTLLFYITPAMLGTVFDTDDINQVACLCFDMLGLIAYLQFTRLYEAKDVSSKQQLYLPLAGWIVLTWLEGEWHHMVCGNTPAGMEPWKDKQQVDGQTHSHRHGCCVAICRCQVLTPTLWHCERCLHHVDTH